MTTHENHSFLHLEQSSRRGTWRLLFGLLLANGIWLSADAAAESLGTLKADGVSVSLEHDAGGLSVEVAAAKSSGQPNVFTLSNPTRLVIDLPGASVKGAKRLDLNDSEATSVRVGTHPDKVRIVLDLKVAGEPNFDVAGGKAGGYKIAIRSAGASSDGVRAVSETAPTETAHTEEHVRTETPPRPAHTEKVAHPLAAESEPSAEQLSELEHPVHQPPQPPATPRPTPPPAAKNVQPKPIPGGEASKAPKEGSKEATAKKNGEDEETLRMLELAEKALDEGPGEEPESEAAEEPAPAKGKAGSKHEPAPNAKEPAPDSKIDAKSSELKNPELKDPGLKNSEPKNTLKQPEPIAEENPEPAAHEGDPFSELGNPAAEEQAKLASKQSEPSTPDQKKQPGGGLVKGIFFRATDDLSTAAIVIEADNLAEYSLSQKKPNLYELELNSASVAGPHLSYPQFPPDSFQGFEVVIAEQRGANVVLKIFVEEGTKLSPYRVKNQLWVKVLR